MERHKTTCKPTSSFCMHLHFHIIFKRIGHSTNQCEIHIGGSFCCDWDVPYCSITVFLIPPKREREIQIALSVQFRMNRLIFQRMTNHKGQRTVSLRNDLETHMFRQEFCLVMKHLWTATLFSIYAIRWPQIVTSWVVCVEQPHLDCGKQCGVCISLTYGNYKSQYQ